MEAIKNTYDKKILDEGEFLNILCDSSFKNLLHEKLKWKSWNDGVKKTYDGVCSDEFFEHKKYCGGVILLNNIIITNRHSHYWKFYQDRINDKFNVCMYGDFIIAEYRETLKEKEDLEIITDKRTNVEYIVSKPYPYYYV